MRKNELIMDFVRRRRTMLLALSVAVVFVITYVLIMPATALDEQEAARQGGIDIAAEEQAGDAQQGDAADSGQAVDIEEAADSGEAAEQTEPADTDAPAKAGQLTADGKGYSVSAEYGAGADLPLGTELTAEEITKDDEDYQAWHDEALKALQETKGGEQIAELQFAKFYDITLAADGDEVQPAAPVDVTISYDKPMKAADADHVRIVHFGVDEKGELVPEVLKAKDVDAQINGKGRMTETAFKAESFSVYAVVYTVDFEYTDEESGETYQFSIPGGDKIRLSELFKVLGIKAQVKDVTDVKFSDESLVKVTKNLFGYDWTLESLKAFKSEETLTVKLADGNEIVVRVTDEQHVVNDVTELLTDVKIDATLGQDGKYIVYEDQPYGIHLTFKENPNGGQLNMTDGFAYQLPDGLFDTIAPNGITTIKLSGGTHAGEEVELAYRLENGKLIFTWPDQSSGAYNQLKDALYTGFTVNIDAQFKKNYESLQFSDTITKELDVKNDGNADVSKTGTYNPKTNCVDYTVHVTSHGICTNVAVHDDISGTALTYNGDAIARSNVYGKTVPSPTTNGNGFDLTIPRMGDNETVTITYSAAVDLSKITSENGVLGTVTQTKNKVTVTPENHPGDEDEKSGKDFHNKISYSTISKSGSAGETGEDGHATVTWTIKANENAHVSMAGHTISDMIDSNSQDIMSYSGGYITVIRRDANGNIVGNADGEKVYLDMNGNSWTWTVPNSAPDTDKLSYEIVYTTDVDVSGRLFNTQVKNTAISDNGGSTSGHADVTPPGGAITARKSVVGRDLSNKIITWEVSFDVPATGLDSARIDDTMPNVWDNSGNLVAIDDYIDGTITIIPALEVGEGYNTSTYTADQKKHLVIDFYKMVDGQEVDGLIGTGSKRKVRVQFQTEIDEAWLEAAANDPNNNNYKIHENNANVVLNGQILGTSASTKIEMTEPGMSKLLDSKSIEYINGIGNMPAFEYTVLLTGVNENSFDENGQIILEDTYNGKYLKYFNNQQYRNGNVTRKNGFMYGSTVTVVDNGATKQGPYVIDEAGSTDGKLRMVLNYSDFTVENGMLDADGSFKPYYFVHYYLAVKDAIALEKLIRTASQSDEGKVELNNTVRNDFFGEESHTVNYEVPVVDKQVGNAEYINGNYVAHYKIVVNKDALQLGDEEELALKDGYENLSIDYTTVKIYDGATYSDNNKVEATGVSWDRKGHTMTYYLKNAHYYIIEYDAKITGTPDDHNKVIYTNTAEVFGVKDTETHEQTFSSGGGGESVTWGIQIFKHKKGAASTPLNATFDLYMYEPTADQASGYENRPADNKGVEKDGWKKVGTLTTGADGVAHTADLDNGNYSLHSQTWYALWETSAPAGYEKKDFSYVFWITTGTTPDYSKYVYVNDDVVAIDNSPAIPETVDVNVEKNWIEEDDEVIEHDPVTVHLYADGDPIEDHVNDEGVKDIVGFDGTVQLGQDGDWDYTWSGLPGGPVYSVVEEHVIGYTTTYSPRNTQGLEGNNTITITNKKIPNKTAIKVKKEWGQGTEKPEDITIQLKRKVSPNAEVRIVNNTGLLIDHVSVPAGSNVKIEFAAIGYPGNGNSIAYELYEGNYSDGKTPIKSEGVAWKTPLEKTVLDSIAVGNDGITLRFPGIYSQNYGDWTFASGCTPVVTPLGGGTGGPSEEDVFYTGEHHYYTLNEDNGWSLVIEHLPLSDDDGSYKYYIEEIGVNDNSESPQDAGYEVTYTNNEGVTEGTINVKNDKETPGKIQVTKSFSGISALPEGFRITNDYNNDVFTVANAQGSGTEENPYTWVIDDIPKGTEVEFTESGASVEGHTLTITANGTAQSDGSTSASASGTAAKPASDGTIPTVAFVNTYEAEPGSLELTKKVAGTGADTNQEFEFTINLDAPAGKTLADSYTFKKNGTALTEDITYTRTEGNTKASVAGIKLKHDDVFTIEGLAAGTQYEIDETDYSADGYSANATSGALEGIITGGGAAAKTSVEVTNTHETGSLHVQKTVSGNGAYQNKAFGFKVTIRKENNGTPNGSYTIKKVTEQTGTEHTFTYAGKRTEVQFYLKHGEEAVFHGLKKNYGVTVEETSADQDGYATSVTSTGGTVNDENKTVTGTISKDSAITAAYVNSKNSLNINILKVDNDNTSTKLGGAVFKLIQVGSIESINKVDEGYEKSGTTSSEEATKGTLAFSDLVPGYYFLQELSPPTGYITTESGWHFQVDEDGIVEGVGDFSPTGTIRYVDENNITVTNQKGAELPSSGGPGTTWIYLLGVILLLGCSTMLIARRRAKE